MLHMYHIHGNLLQNFHQYPLMLSACCWDIGARAVDIGIALLVSGLHWMSQVVMSAGAIVPYARPTETRSVLAGVSSHKAEVWLRRAYNILYEDACQY